LTSLQSKTSPFAILRNTEADSSTQSNCTERNVREQIGKETRIRGIRVSYLRHECDPGDAIARISGETYRMFDRLNRASAYGRVLSFHDSIPP